MAALVAVAPSAANAAGTTLNIKVGAGPQEVNGVGFEGMRFDAPTTIAVHKGDVLNFAFEGFHTATLLPTGVSADEWRLDHTGAGGDFSLLQRDTDETKPTFELNTNVLFPTDPTCGTTSKPCTYDGSNVVNSGVPINAQSFAVTINANPGDTFWVLCLVHSMMQMRVEVVANNATTTTQTTINNYTNATIARDVDDAAGVIPKLQRQTRHKTASGHWVWDAYAGYDGTGWGLDGMFPKNLHIKKGQTVRWHFAQLLGNTHTVTFPRSVAVSLSNDFQGQNVKCESSTGDTRPTAAPPTFCSSGIQNAEFEIRGIGVLQEGNNKYFGTGLRSSGARGADGLTTRSYNLTFEKRTSRGWHYACAIHGGMMSGTVFVS